MKILKLNEAHVPHILPLANFVFENSIRQGQQPNIQRVIGYFREYAREDAIREQVANGSLHMWGIKNGNYYVAVSAMNSQGHITMLYVHPQFVRRKYGKKLLREMRVFAANELGLNNVTVNVMPVWAASFFAVNGFKPCPQSEGMGNEYVSMTASSISEVRYKTKKISNKLFVGISVGCPILITLITIAYTLYYLNV